MRPRFSLIALAALLAGCAGSGVPDDHLARMLVAPEKFALYNCEALADKAREVATRQRRLERLMEQAKVDSGGRLVSTLAYRPEYLVARGEMIDLQAEARDKNCDFVPGAHMARAEGADAAAVHPPPPASRPPGQAR